MLAAGSGVAGQTITAARRFVAESVDARAALVTVRSELTGRAYLLLLASQSCVLQ